MSFCEYLVEGLWGAAVGRVRITKFTFHVFGGQEQAWEGIGVKYSANVRDPQNVQGKCASHINSE